MSLRSLASRTLAFAFLWWVIAEGRVDNLGLAAITVALAVAAGEALSRRTSWGFSMGGALAFAGFFLVESVKAGCQVALMAFRPRLALDPAMVRVPLTLPPGLARVMLLNTLTLLPGTLSVRVDGEQLCLHVLDRGLPVGRGVHAAQARIARLLEIAA